MASSLSKIAYGFIITTATINVAFAEEQKFDHKLEAAIMAKAADKIGAIRGTIDFKKTAEIITENKAKVDPVEVKNWVTPKPRKERPDRISSITNEIDPIITTGVVAPTKKSIKKLQWDKFDRYGNPLIFQR